MRVHIRLAPEVLDQVDDDLHPARIGELELLGPDSESDLRQARLLQLGQMSSRSSSSVESPILTPSAVMGSVTRFIAGEPMKPATNALAGLS